MIPDPSNHIPRKLESMQPVLKQVEQVSSGWINKYLLTYSLADGTEIEYESVSRKGLELYTEELKRAGKSQLESNAPVENPSQAYQEHFNRESVESCPEFVDAISIVPRTTSDELVLIKEFRYPINNWCISFPAGLMEPNESILDCLKRELKEETGYQLHDIGGKNKIRPLFQSSYSTTGMSEENILIVYALVEKAGEPEPDDKELIEVFTVPLSEVGEFLQQNPYPIGTRCQLILESFARDKKRKDT